MLMHFIMRANKFNLLITLNFMLLSFSFRYAHYVIGKMLN